MSMRASPSSCSSTPSTTSYGNLNNNDGANGYRDYGRVNWAGKSYNAGTLALEHTMYTNADNIAGLHRAATTWT